MNIEYFIPLLVLVIGAVAMMKGWAMMLTKGSFKRGLAWMVVAPLITVIAVALSIGAVLPSKEQIALDAAQEAQEAAADKLAGLHCTSVFGQMRNVLLGKLRDPDSYDEVSRDYGVVDAGTRIFTLEYLARNGFGGMNREVVAVKVDQETCDVVEVIATE